MLLIYLIILVKQVILCVETSKKANTDGLYISKALKSLYRIDNSVKLTYVYCEGKPKYASKLKEINDAKTKIKDSIVVYLFDTDSIDIDVQHQTLNEEIIKYCNLHNIAVQASCPLSRMSEKLLRNDVLTMLSGKYHKNIAQLSLRWLLQHDVLSIPRTKSVAHMKENYAIFDYEIEQSDMEILNSIVL